MPEKNSMGKPGSPAGLRLLTKKEVARLLACSIRMVERLVALGTLTAVSSGARCGFGWGRRNSREKAQKA